MVCYPCGVIQRAVDVSAGCATALLCATKTVIRQVVSPDADPDAAPRPGEVVWVREPWALRDGDRVALQALESTAALSWQPPRTMPLAASRLRLEILSVRQERLRAIPDDELEAEGALWRAPGRPAGETEREGFARWWDSLHRRPGTRWADDPLVFVLRVALVAPS
jgi:hypothetical protein